jgi:hypothetical protein
VLAHANFIDAGKTEIAEKYAIVGYHPDAANELS